MIKTALITMLMLYAPKLLVLSTTNNVTCIDTETGTVTPDVVTPGQWPNDILWFQEHFYVVNSGSDDCTLQKIDPETWQVEILGIGSGYNCWAVEHVKGDTLAVSSAVNNSIILVNASTMTIIGEITGVGPNPEWFAVVGDSIYAACGGWMSSDKVVVADLNTMLPVDTITTFTNTQGCTWDGVDQVYAICTGSYTANDGEIHVIETATGTVSNVIQTGFAPAFGVMRGDLLYVGDVYGQGVISINTVTATLEEASQYPGGSGLSVDENNILWVANYHDGTVKGYDENHAEVAGYSGISSCMALEASRSAGSSVEGDCFIPVNPHAGISAFPSPASSVVQVALPPANSSTPALYSLSGRRICAAAGSSGDLWTFDVSTIPQGIYLIRAGKASCRISVVR
ncbi:hypothetical protein CSA37_01245 [Candidatus Fermentibacteria bacterium]|nr:MAG: hypothetical protein CSA37_13495 [Candidatus Fermentibacteria bacterium]PIE51913.1 MAG: hypothetical protein CSA37_09030 [Candidatus Fermentibacteria bacterium]PIE53475.1 MAG: hypothetical protein CSA37_01245 [Candidatus Fermentibacteria bacterium]